MNSGQQNIKMCTVQALICQRRSQKSLITLELSVNMIDISVTLMESKHCVYGITLLWISINLSG